MQLFLNNVLIPVAFGVALLLKELNKYVTFKTKTFFTGPGKASGPLVTALERQ